MRIVKDAACGILRDEIAELGRQCDRCRLQLDKLDGWGLQGVSGRAVTAADEHVRMQAAVVRAHLAFFRSVMGADRSCLELVEALPTTSPGVVDTDTARERMEAAGSRIEILSRQQEEARAQLMGPLSARLESSCSMTPRPPWYYQGLIDEQEAVRRYNQRVMEEAERFERSAARIYAAVDTTAARHASSSVGSFLASGSWGDVRWTHRLAFAQQASTFRRARRLPPARSGYERFLHGDLQVADAGWSARIGSGRPQGSLVATGEALGVEASLTPFRRLRQDAGDAGPEAAAGAKASAEVYVARGSATEATGFGQGSLSAALLSGAAEAGLGGSLYADGGFSPAAEAKAELSASVVEVGAQAGLGGELLGMRIGVSGQGLAAEAGAGAAVSRKGVEVSADAQAYAATGAVSAGATFLGLRVDASLEAKLAGAGAKARAEVTSEAVEGELGLGLGVGLGAKVRVDWGGVASAARSARARTVEWWDCVTGVKEHAYV